MIDRNRYFNVKGQKINQHSKPSANKISKENFSKRSCKKIKFIEVPNSYYFDEISMNSEGNDNSLRFKHKFYLINLIILNIYIVRFQQKWLKNTCCLNIRWKRWLPWIGRCTHWPLARAIFYKIITPKASGLQ